jgi:DNA-directed RNA polymerase specialized sigma24 family protein
MSKMAELAYDIEQLYIEGLHPTKIAKTLGCPLSMVYDWLKDQSLEVEKENKGMFSIKDDFSPYATFNS